MDHSERIDRLIRSRIQLLAAPLGVEPSQDFTRRTMAKIELLERRHQFKRDLWVLFLALFPAAFQEIWYLWARGDYFSPSQWPLGSIIVRAYNIFISQLGVTILLAISVAVFVGYVLRFRRAGAALTPSTHSYRKA